MTGLQSNARIMGVSPGGVYNQGVILGGLKELFLITGDSTYLNDARRFAHASIKLLADSNGVLNEPCNKCYMNHDLVQFKGIYIRYLSELNVHC